MNYFLAKTEPEEYSIEDLQKDGENEWTGVNNPQAKNFLKSMQTGDVVYIYHTGKIRAIVGVSIVSKTGEIPHFKFKSILKVPVTLRAIKAKTEFNDLKLVRQSRLSVMDVPLKLVKFIEEKQK